MLTEFVEHGENIPMLVGGCLLFRETLSSSNSLLHTGALLGLYASLSIATLPPYFRFPDCDVTILSELVLKPESWKKVADQ